MPTPNNTSNELDDQVPLAIRVVSNGRSNSVLHSAPPVSNDAETCLQGQEKYRTFLGGPPEWKCGLSTSRASSSNPPPRIFFIDVIGVNRLTQRLLFCSGCVRASMHRRCTISTGFKVPLVFTNITATLLSQGLGAEPKKFAF